MHILDTQMLHACHGATYFDWEYAMQQSFVGATGALLFSGGYALYTLTQEEAGSTHYLSTSLEGFILGCILGGGLAID